MMARHRKQNTQLSKNSNSLKFVEELAAHAMERHACPEEIVMPVRSPKEMTTNEAEAYKKSVLRL